MAEVEKELLNRFYQEYWIFLVLFIFIVIVSIALIIFCFMRFKKMPSALRIITPITSVVLVTLCCFFGMIFSNYYSDYCYLKNDSPITIEGTVIGYSIASSSDDLTVTKSWPIINISETDEEISLNIIKAEEKLVIDEVYVFIYIPNTKIAEIIEHK